MMLPDPIPVVVPEFSGKPWEIDLKHIIFEFLGPTRKVIVLGHNQNTQIKNFTVTPFPFEGELPPSLSHNWNCYFFETEKSSVACTADSVLGNTAVNFLTQKMRGRSTELLVCGRKGHSGESKWGYRDSEFPEIFYNPMRLYPWYLPPVQLFDSTQRLRPSFSILKELYKNAKLRNYFAYATGSTPWFRISDPEDAFDAGVGSLSLSAYQKIRKDFKKVSPNIKMLPAKYGIPFKI